jgi:hypothetical protein
MSNDKQRPRQVISQPSNRITIAFPFSGIRIQEPSEQVRALAQLVTELAEQLAKASPSVETDLLVERARTIVTGLD